SGKSTLLRAIHECPDCKGEIDPSTALAYFNSETMNPHRNESAHTGRGGSLIKVRAMFSSHGEILRDVLGQMKFKRGDTILLDEPENGQDLSWIIKIHRGLLTLTKSGVQVIAASHHPVCWRDGTIIELRQGYAARMRAKYQSYL
ncbi:MAG: hypothetical protein K8I00_05440, partial [Candidatus Omnitrophica bacterium]|nr:hypothetical protein [Candidatus Omnitrophota bacterium]